MSTFSARAVTLLVLLFAQGLAPGKPPGPAPARAPEAGLPVGTWRVEYANGITEVCEVGRDGAAVVVEPKRIGGGKAVVGGGAVVMVFENGRVQRWTPVGARYVVEHWFPRSQFPTTAAGVVGIAEAPRGVLVRGGS